MEQYNLQVLNLVLGSIVAVGACRYISNHVKQRIQRSQAEQKRWILWSNDVMLRLYGLGIAHRRPEGGYLTLPYNIDRLPQELYRLDFSVEEAVTHIRLLSAVTDGEDILK